MVGSLFRAVPLEQFHRARNIFLRIRDDWNVPLSVANDGDVTALAGAMSLQANGMLGLAMGSSQAAGYIKSDGCMTGALNELAFAPVDYNPDADADEWSGDRGVGVMCFSQQAVNKLLPAAGISLPEQMGLPERLQEVQKLMAKGDARAAKIYENARGVSRLHDSALCRFLFLSPRTHFGRVMTGAGADIMLEQARKFSRRSFPK